MPNFANVLSGSKPLLCSKLKCNANKVVVCENAAEVNNLTLQLRFFGYSNIITLHARDNKPYEVISTSVQCKHSRMRALHSINKLHIQHARGNAKDSDTTIIVTTFLALAQKIGCLNSILFNILSLKVSQETSMQIVLDTLVKLGFNRNSTALEFGEFAVRGSILDIVSESEFGYRIDFFGNKIESIRKYLPSTQRSVANVNEVEILPVDEIILNDAQINNFLSHVQISKASDNIMLESVKCGIPYPGLENYLPYFYKESLGTILNYLPKNTIICINYEHLKGYNSYFTKIFNFYEQRKNYSAEQKFYKPLYPSELFTPPEELEIILNKLSNSGIKVVEYSEFAVEGGVNIAKKGKNFYQHALLAKKDYLALFKEFLARNNKSSKAQNYIICCANSTSLQHALSVLKRAEIYPKAIDNIVQINGTKLFIAVYPIEEGFEDSNNLFISEQDLFGKCLGKRQRSKAGSKSALNYLNEIKCGELIVHKEHGIGRFEEIKPLEIGGKIHDFIVLTYANADKLYLPVENLELISKYGEDGISAKQLDKLGAASWQRRKVRLKAKIRMHATELIKNAATRASKTGTIFEAENEVYQKFASAFQYIETPDQERSIAEVLGNLKLGIPMDCLLCGDVGFGKTEVALRAACAVTCNSSGVKAQVMVVVPTTLLARQHYKIFIERFAALGIKVAQLSRFTKRDEIQQIKENLKAGEIDIIIGTHALLANDILPQNLGLIIIDEEQHFGVKQKEKLKKLKSNVHILTLSATPIPRTLHMSLNGVKSLSLLTTPPVTRIPVRTFVMPFDEITIRDAIMREKLRGGRTFIVTPRVQYMTKLEREISEMFEEQEVKIASAHGKLSSLQLDSVMNKFYDGHYDVLISTSIIESGLDIPSANTIIIDRAHMFGLAQAYQIRGRVGRSNVKAYAYFTYPNTTILTENAKKRLSILQSLEDLGGGFHIASHDMEIRGYGNLLGEEQSGHIKEVGMELYQDMLSEAVAELKASHSHVEDAESDHDWSPRLNLGISIQIPHSYISNSNLKLSFYRRIANINNQEEKDSLCAEMIDRFGPLPNDASHLFFIVELKQQCKLLNIEKFDVSGGKAIIKFRNNKPKNAGKVIEFINKNPATATLRSDMSVCIECIMPKESTKKIDCLLSLLQNF